MKTVDDIGALCTFLKEIRAFHLTYRFTPKPDGGFESDAEHSWSVAFTCMLLAGRLEKEFDIHLDQSRMLKMALIHDLAELEVGDTKPWDHEAREGKEEKERTAMHHIVRNLPDDIRKEIIALWEESERRETLEAKIVKSIDRMDPDIYRITFDIGWEGIIDEEHATAESFDSRQRYRHEFSKTLTTLYEAVRAEALQKGTLKAE
jgi:putative hydrolase of HD superfamily